MTHFIFDSDTLRAVALMPLIVAGWCFFAMLAHMAYAERAISYALAGAVMWAVCLGGTLVVLKWLNLVVIY